LYADGKMKEEVHASMFNEFHETLHKSST